MGLGISFLLIVFYLILSAFFSGSETAFFSLSKVQIKKLENAKSAKSRRVNRLLKNPRELLIIILLGNTIVNVLASSTAALIAITIGENHCGDVPRIFAILIEIIIMTILLLVFGEITPKLLAFSAPVKIASNHGLLIEIVKYLLWPAIKILDLISAIFSKVESNQNKSNLTSEEFKNLINSKATEDSLEENEKKIIASIFKFSSTTAREILIPRVDMIAADISDGVSNVKDVIMGSGYSKIPIYKQNIDNIVGMVYAKDIILNPKKQSINSLLRPALFVTENVIIQNLLNQFKKSKIQIAIVVDEYGGTTGLITLEDILEELVGEIMDEYDEETLPLTKISENEYKVSGMYSIADLNSEFYLDIDEEEYDNLAEFIFDNFNRVPKINEEFIYNNRAVFTIINISSQRINYVKMRLLNQIINENDES